jgi:hypothetical protein
LGVAIAARLIALKPQAAKRTADRQAVRVVAAPVEVLTDYTVQIREYGAAEPKRVATISPQVAGKVLWKSPDFVRWGQVAKGQKLLEIDKTDYLQAKQSAEAQIGILDAQKQRLTQQKQNLDSLLEIERSRLELARKQLQNARKLLAENAASPQDVDSLQEALLARQASLIQITNEISLIPRQLEEIDARLEGARTELARAKTALERVEIRSPVTGGVLASTIEEQVPVAVGQDCGQVFATDVMEIPVSVPAAELAWIDRDKIGCKPEPGQAETLPDPQTSVRADVYWQDQHWIGCVDRLEPGLEAQTRAARLIVRVVNSLQKNPNPLERNMFCRVVIHGRTLPRAVLLPRLAVRESDRGPYVLLAEDGRLARKWIQPARYSRDQAMLVPSPNNGFGGLEPRDQVIQSQLAAEILGMHVEPVPAGGQEVSATAQRSEPATDADADDATASAVHTEN